MGVTRTLGRSVGAVIGIIAFLIYGIAPAAGVGSEADDVEPYIGPELPVADPLPGTPLPAFAATVAFGDGVHLVVWDDGRFATRVDQSGNVLDPEPLILPNRGGSNADVAFDGRNFLMVWDEWNSGAGVNGMRVSPDGEVLDPSPIVLTEERRVRNAKISFDGTNSLVVWETPEGLSGTRVSPAGTVLEPAHPVVSGAVDLHHEVAFNGSHHLVVWERHLDAGTDVYGTLVTPDGSPVTPGGVPIAAADGDQWRPAVAALGGSFFVVWDDRRNGQVPEVYGSRVDAAGSVLDPSGIRIATASGFQAAPDIASDGTNVLVVWQSESGAVGARVDSSGSVLDPSGFAVSTLRSDLVVAFGGDNNYLVVGQVDGSIGGARVTGAGAVLDPTAFPISIGNNPQHDPASAFDGTNTFVVWRDDRAEGAGPGVYGGRVGPTGEILDGTGFLIAGGASRPSVAFDGTDYLVVYVQGVDQQDHAIRAARVTRGGVVRDRLTISTGGLGESVDAPRVVFGGGIYLVTWEWWVDLYPQIDNEVRAARVSTDGLVLDPNAFRALDDVVQFDLAFGGTEFLLVSKTNFFSSGINGRWVTKSGGVSEPFPISPDLVENLLFPEVAWNGRVFLVVWTVFGDEFGEEGFEIAGARVDGSGVVLDPAGITIAAGSGLRAIPGVAANGPFLVAWQERRRGGDGIFHLYATRVDPDGTVADPGGFDVSPWGSPLSAPAVTAAPVEGTFSVAYARSPLDGVQTLSRTYLRHVWPK